MKRKVFILLTFILAVACTKYKYDSSISLKPAYSRIWGKWKIDYYEIDGKDSTAKFCNYPYSCCSVEFSDKSDPFHSRFNVSDCSGEYENGFELDKKKIYWWRGAVAPVNSSTGYDFDILKLYKTDFWITKTISEKKYFIKFKKQ